MLDVKVLRLAGRQRSLVTRQQLIELGCPKALIEAWLDAGLLFRVHRGVYALAGARVDFDFKVLAGVLAAGEGAVASHRTAGALFGLRRITCDSVEVTVPGRRAPKGKGLIGHRSDRFDPADLTLIGVVPVTAPARTLLDLAGVLNPSRLGGVLDDVIVRKLASLGAIERLLARTADQRRSGAACWPSWSRSGGGGRSPPKQGSRTSCSRCSGRMGCRSRSGSSCCRFRAEGRHASMPPIRTCCSGSRRTGTGGTRACWTGCGTRPGTSSAGGSGGSCGYGTEDIRERPAGIADEVLRLRRGAEAA